MRHEGKVKIPASGEECPCGAGTYGRIAKCDESTNRLNLHYDICSRCGFEVYAHVGPTWKLKRFVAWGGCQIGYHTEARLLGEKIINIASSVIAIVVVAVVAAMIIDRMTL